MSLWRTKSATISLDGSNHLNVIWILHLQNHSGQGLYCLPFRLHLLDALLCGKTIHFQFRIISAIFSGVRIFPNFSVHICCCLLQVLQSLGKTGKTTDEQIAEDTLKLDRQQVRSPMHLELILPSPVAIVLLIFFFWKFQGYFLLAMVWENRMNLQILLPLYNFFPTVRLICHLQSS